MHFHIAFLVGLVATALKVTDKLEGVWSFFLTFASLKILDVVSSELSVVVKSFTTLLTTEFLRLVVNYLNVLGQVGESFLAVWTCFQLLVRVLDAMNVVSVLVQDGLFVEYFVAEIAGI